MSQQRHAVAVADSFVLCRHGPDVLPIKALHISLELLGVNVLHTDELKVIALVILNFDGFLEVKYHVLDIEWQL